ncbi:MAG TPA: hypothetical protein VHV54_10135 [Candidatus Binatia bacterium]|nr:hypothetical protein [Candidatus Binatia bacterium]
MKLESAGIPTAAVVTEEFLTLALTEARSRGMADLPLIRVPHPVGTLGSDALRSLAARSVDSIAGQLVCGEVKASSDQDTPPSPNEDDSSAKPRVPSDPAEMFDLFAERGWTDGLPVLPPTPSSVARMIAAGGQKRDDVLGVVPPLKGVATIEKIAANAVMAGCLPEYFPLVIAATRGVLQAGFNLDGVQTTTGNVAPMIIVNGPCRNSLKVNYGPNVLGQGWRANATIGRAVRFILTNIGGATPGLFDKSTVGQPAKYTFCFAENEEESPWEPLHVQRGNSQQTNTVSVTGCSGVYSAVDMASQTAQRLLKTFALTMTGGLASGVTTTEVLFVICPEHAAILAAGGHSKASLCEALFALARVPFEKISDENLELLSKRRPLWFKNGAAREIGAVDRPEDIWIVVAGGPGAKSAYIPGRTGTRMQTVCVASAKTK